MDLMYVQTDETFPDLILFHQGYVFLASAFPCGLWNLGFLKVSLASKDWGK